MISFVLSLLISTIIFSFIVPKVRGAYFKGDIPIALLLAASIQCVMFGLSRLIEAFLVIVSLTHPDLNPVWLILFTGAAFWLVPSLWLKLQARWKQSELGFSSWKSVLIVGFVIGEITLIIDILPGGLRWH